MFLSNILTICMPIQDFNDVRNLFAGGFVGNGLCQGFDKSALRFKYPDPAPAPGKKYHSSGFCFPTNVKS